MNRRMILIIIIFAVILIGVGVGGFFLYKNLQEEKQQNEELSAELESAHQELLSYGKAVPILIAGRDLSVGKQVTELDFEKGTLPSSMVTGNYIASIEEIKDYYYKLDVAKGTPITRDLLLSTEVTKTLRYLDVVADLFPVEARVGDYYDFRIITPGGEDYIFLTKKRVLSNYGSAVRLFMDENDIHTYQSALVDAYLNPGTLVYVTKYVEPSMQVQATPYYPVSDVVLKVMDLDPNIVTLAEQDVTARRRQEFESGLNLPDKVIQSIVSGRAGVVGKLNQAAQNWLQQNGESGLSDGVSDIDKQNQETTPQESKNGVTGGSTAGDSAANNGEGANSGNGDGSNGSNGEPSGGNTIANPNASAPGETGGTTPDIPNAPDAPGFFENNYNPGRTDPNGRN